MTVGEIIEEYLKKNNLDGLCCEDCFCPSGELFRCKDDGADCQPGHASACNCDVDCGQTHIVPEE